MASEKLGRNLTSICEQLSDQFKDFDSSATNRAKEHREERDRIRKLFQDLKHQLSDFTENQDFEAQGGEPGSNWSFFAAHSDGVNSRVDSAWIGLAIKSASAWWTCLERWTRDWPENCSLTMVTR